MGSIYSVYHLTTPDEDGRGNSCYFVLHANIWKVLSLNFDKNGLLVFLRKFVQDLTHLDARLRPRHPEVNNNKTTVLIQ
jgi:hypothetical protein